MKPWPPDLSNPPDQPSLNWRVGNATTFTDRMVALLHNMEPNPDGQRNPLTRVPLEDPTNMVSPLLECWAKVGDILAFYQERAINEGYVGTAVQPDSLVYLAAEVGYQPASGLAAGTWLAFDVTPKARTGPEITLPERTAVQGTPPAGGGAVVFETQTALRAHVSFNAMTLVTTPPTVRILAGSDVVIAATVGLPLKVGDPVALGGDSQLAPFTVKALAKVSAQGVTLIQLDRSVGPICGVPQMLRFSAKMPVLGATAKAWNTVSERTQLAAGATPRGGIVAGTSWSRADAGLANAPVSLMTSAGRLRLVGTAGNGLFKATGSEAFRQLGTSLQRSSILAMQIAQDDRWYVGTADGRVLVSVDGGVTWDAVPGHKTITETRWSLTWKDKRPRCKRRTVHVPADLPGSAVRSVLEVGASLVAGTDSGVYATVLGSGEWFESGTGMHGSAGKTSRACVRALVERDGLWAITDAGVFRASHLGAHWVLERGDVDGTCAVLAEDGAMLVGTRTGLLRYDGAWTWLLQGTSVSDLASSSAGVLVATAAGLYQGTTAQVHLKPGATAKLGTEGVTSVAWHGAHAQAAAPADGVQQSQWPHYDLVDGVLQLAKTEQLAVGSWVLATQSDGAASQTQTWEVVGTDVAVTESFAVNAPVTELTLTPAITKPSLSSFDRQQLTLFGRSVEVPLSTTQVWDTSLAGSEGIAAIAKKAELYEELVTRPWQPGELPSPPLLIQGHVPNPTGRVVAIRGRRPRVIVMHKGLLLESSQTSIPLTVGQELFLESPPLSSGMQWRFDLEDLQGFKGQVVADADALPIYPSESTDPVVMEAALVSQAVGVDGNTKLELTDLDGKALEALGNAYDPNTVQVNANTVWATQGATHSNVALGSGDPSIAGQVFPLKGSPLTRLPAPAPLPLEVRVDGLLWTEVDTLFESSSTDRVYTVTTDASGITRLHFGDGVYGSLLPAGRDNVRATYRLGLGESGNLPAASLITVHSPTASIKRVTNPVAATGGTDPEGQGHTRQRAPLSVRALDRVVTEGDYVDFAATWPSTAKVTQAILWTGSAAVVHLTLATRISSEDNQPSETEIQSLKQALEAAGGRMPVIIQPFEPSWFQVDAVVRIASGYDTGTVESGCRSALVAAFAFDRRDLAQGVAGSEVITALQAVEGVVEVDLVELQLTSTGLDASVTAVEAWGPDAWLPGQTACWTPTGAVPAGLLLLDTASGIRLEVRQ